MSTTTLLLVALLILALSSGYGFRARGWGAWSPAGIVLVVLLILYVTGRLR